MCQGYLRIAALAAVVCLLMADARPAAASGVQLPPGNLNGASNTCPEGAASAEFLSERNSRKMRPGQRLAVEARAGDDFRMKCAHDGVEISVGTGCFFDGYVIAGFEPGAMRIACYEGSIPAEWRASE